MERLAHEDAVTFAWSATGTVIRTNLKAYGVLLALGLLCHLVGFAIAGNLITGFGITLVTVLACIRLVRPEAAIARSTIGYSAAFSAVFFAIAIAMSALSHFSRYAHAWTFLIIAAVFAIAIITLKFEAALFFHALYPGTVRDALARSWALFNGRAYAQWFWINVAVGIGVIVVGLPVAMLTVRIAVVHFSLDFIMQVLQTAFLMCYLAYVTDRALATSPHLLRS